LREDGVQELLRNPVLVGDIQPGCEFLWRKPRQMHHGLEAVLALHGQHDAA